MLSQELLAEITAHQKHLNLVLEKGRRLAASSTSSREEIQQRCYCSVTTRWSQWSWVFLEDEYTVDMVGGPALLSVFHKHTLPLFQMQTAECRVGGARGDLQQEKCVLEQSHEQGAGEAQSKKRKENHKSKYHLSLSRKEREEPAGCFRNCFGSFQS